MDQCSGNLLEQDGMLEMGKENSFYVYWKGTGIDDHAGSLELFS